MPLKFVASLVQNKQPHPPLHPYQTSLFVIPLVTTVHTFVKDTHGFIRRSQLDLQKVGRPVTTLGARGLSSIHMFPGGFAAQNVVYLFALCVANGGCGFGNGPSVGASGADKAVLVGSTNLCKRV